VRVVAVLESKLEGEEERCEERVWEEII